MSRPGKKERLRRRQERALKVQHLEQQARYDDVPVEAPGSVANGWDRVERGSRLTMRAEVAYARCWRVEG